MSSTSIGIPNEMSNSVGLTVTGPVRARLDLRIGWSGDEVSVRGFSASLEFSGWPLVELKASYMEGACRMAWKDEILLA